MYTKNFNKYYKLVACQMFLTKFLKAQTYSAVVPLSAMVLEPY
jgi:hypothetical protein